jgi:pimeloyl-ACP methyl ester carboxylesterase
MAEPITRTLQAPGATITYDIRHNDTTTEPPLMLIGSPMAASGLATLAGFFGDRTVVTYDPRGAERSTKEDPGTESDPGQHADDLHRIIGEVGGPVDLFASSGGAVNALALVAAYPHDVRTLVAHEPPAFGVLPDGDNALAAIRAISDAYEKDGFGAGMSRFLAVSMHRGEILAGLADQPGPDPAMFGLPTEDDGSRDDALLHQNIITCTHFQPDFEALRAAPTRIVVGAGEESDGELANRSAKVIAERLGRQAVVFPSHHGGFVGGDGPWAGKPAEFAVTLREALA